MERKKAADKAAKGKIKRAAKILFIGATLAFCLVGCTEKKVLDAKNPTVISLWHYQDGSSKAQLDAQIKLFNETVGKEQGIVVEAQSRGNSMQLAEVVFDAANKTIGSDPMPDIFTAYPDNAYRIDKVAELVDLEQYFTKEELAQYYPAFLDNDRIGADKKLKLLPISKSTEGIFLNQTDWDKFSLETGAQLSQLTSWEGMARTAQQYYRWTDEKTTENNDGKAFWGIDSMYHFMLMASRQTGQEMYKEEADGTVSFQYSKELAKRVWDIYYEGYLRGWYKKENTYTSADVAAGSIIASVMSTAGGNYFPTKMTVDKSESYSVDCGVLPYPVMENGKPYAPIRGMDMCITKSDAAHEYASAVFLKWFTAPQQNSAFTAGVGFLPVQNSALTPQAIEKAREQVLEKAPNPAITTALRTAQNMLSTYTLYNSKPFSGDYEIKQLLENSLPDFAKQDLQQLDKRVTAGENREELIAQYISQDNFEQWYAQFTQAAAAILIEKRV